MEKSVPTQKNYLTFITNIFKITWKKENLLTKYLFILAILINANVKASILHFNAGTFVQYFNQVQINTSGQKKTFTLMPYFGLGANLPIKDRLFFSPEFGFMKYTDALKGVEKSQIFLHYNLAYALADSILLRTGLTTHWYQLKGTGGKQKLNNGNSSTEFDLPDSNVTSYFTTLNFGVENRFHSQYAVRFDYQMMNIKNTQNRAANYLLTLNYYW